MAIVVVARHRLALLAALTLAACQGSGEGSVTPGDPAPAAAPATTAEAIPSNEAERQRALELRYRLALTHYDHGEYEQAATQFSQLLLQVPQTAEGDRLRHLLIQHIAWSRLACFDRSGELAQLDAGEAMLERYLVKHEALLPTRLDERVDIYALLDVYGQRRQGLAVTPTPMSALVRETARTLASGDASRRGDNEDRMVREIEVDTIPWARADDPRVQAYFNDPRYTGGSIFEKPGQPFNPARVLVRGRTGEHPELDGDRHSGKSRARAVLADARPRLERCYEIALTRGAQTYVPATLDLSWRGHDVEANFAEPAGLDAESQLCVLEAVQAVMASEPTEAPIGARLQLSFFIQPARWPSRGDQDYDYFGPTRAPDSGPINEGAVAEDASRVRYTK